MKGEGSVNERTECMAEKPPLRRRRLLAGGRLLIVPLVLITLWGIGAFLHSLRSTFLSEERADDRVIALISGIGHLATHISEMADLAVKHRDAGLADHVGELLERHEAAVEDLRKHDIPPTPNSEFWLFEDAALGLAQLYREVATLVRQGRSDAAAALLNTEEFERKGREYEVGLMRSRSSLTEESDRRHRSRLKLVMGGAALTVVAILGSAFLILIVRQRRRDNAFLRHIIESIPHPFWVLDPEDYSIVMANSAARRQQQSNASTCYGARYGRTSPCEDSEHTCPIALVKEKKECAVVEHAVCEEGGQTSWRAVHVYPILDAHGSVSRVIEHVMDITEWKRAEKELRESEEKFRCIGAQAQDAVIMIDGDGRISFWNQAAERTFGYTADEVLGRNLHRLLAPERFLEAVDRAYPRFRQTGEGTAVGKTLELAALKKNGEEISVELSLSAVQLKGRWNAIGIVRDITDRRAMEEALRVAKEKAEAVSVAKSQFLANMSHEIRTPLNGIIGMTGLTLRTELGEEQRCYLEAVKSSSDHLLGILNEILDLSKVEADRLELEEIDFDLRSALEFTLEQVAVRAQEKGLELLSDIDEDVPALVVGDPGRLRQIVLNLVDNAIKFTESGQVALTCERRAETSEGVELHFVVSDTGIGIPADKQNRIFEVFQQADGSMTRRFGGTGLGLPIAKGLCENMGGKMWVESQPGMGSSFHFTVMVGLRPEDQRPPLGAIPDDLRGSREQVDGKQRWVKPLRILLAEDNQINQMMAVKTLEQFGHTVTVAANGKEAVEQVEKGGVDVVLMDGQMPIMDGLEATRIIRKAEGKSGHRLPIIAMTAHAMKGDREQFLASGMDDYMAKPIDPERLREMLEKWGERMSETEPRTAKPLKSETDQAEPEGAIPVNLEKALARAAGDRAFLEEMILHFVNQIDEQLERFKRFVESGDTAGLAAEAHSLKGSAGTLGVERIASVALRLEQTAKNEDPSAGKRLLSDLSHEMERLRVHVSQPDWMEGN